LKDGLNDRISVNDSTVTDFLRKNELEITKYVLLDPMDWMGARDIGDEWRQVLRRAAPRARAIFRSVHEKPALESVELEIQNGVTRRYRLAERLSFDRALAAKLHRRDRVGTYRAFFIADFAGEVRS
jgi:S-adenosylmethionine-diacylglycerol 3-amino-3-carboxypropyl transferase